MSCRSARCSPTARRDRRSRRPSRARSHPARDGVGLRPDLRDSTAHRGCGLDRARGSRADARRRQGVLPRLGRQRGRRSVRERRKRRHERRHRAARERDDEGPRRQGLLPARALRGLRTLVGERHAGHRRRRDPPGTDVRRRRREREVLRRRDEDLSGRPAGRRAARRPHDRGRDEARPRAHPAGPLCPPGTHLPHPKAELLRGRVVTVESDSPVPIELDGEQPGTTPARFEALPAKIRLRVPAA